MHLCLSLMAMGVCIWACCARLRWAAAWEWALGHGHGRRWAVGGVSQLAWLFKAITTGSGLVVSGHKIFWC